MATSNEEIRDALIRHQVDIFRFGKGLAGRLVGILNKAEPELRREIKRRIERAVRLGGDPGPATTKRLNEINRVYAEIMQPTWAAIRDLTRDELLELGLMETAFFTAATATALPVIVNMNTPSTADIRGIMSQTPMQGQVLAGWLASWRANDRRRAMEQIRTGMLFSETPVQISRRIFGTAALGGTDGARQITRRGALTLANTATSMITNQVKRDIYDKNADIIDRELYVATLDSRTTPICRSLDGKRFPVGEGPRPPVHINCRSVRVPAFNGEEMAGERPANAATEKALEGLSRSERAKKLNELVGTVPAKTTYQEWLTRQTAAFQDEVLGRSKGRLFRRGGVELGAFVDQTGAEYTLDELRERLPARAFERAGL